MNKFLRNTLIVLGFIFLILFITNPKQTDFISYIKAKGFQVKDFEDGYNTVQVGYGRIKYFGLFSVYEYRTFIPHCCSAHSTYFGIFKNFILLNSKEEKIK